MSIPLVRSKALVITLRVAFGLFFTCLSGSVVSANSHSFDTAEVMGAYAQLPLSFEANQGQTDRQVKFLSRGPGYALFLTPTGAVLFIESSKRPVHQESFGDAGYLRSKAKCLQAAVLRIRLEHANGNAKVSGIDQCPRAKPTNFIGNDPAKWRREYSDVCQR